MSTAEWVEIIEPRTKEHMFANLTTGECVWDPPVGVPVKKTDDNQWWELFDQNTSRFYYYNATSQKTVWHRPTGCDIIPLAKLQTLKQNTEPKEGSEKSLSQQKSEEKRSSKDDLAQTTASSRLSKLAEKTKPTRTAVHSTSGIQTSPTSSPRPKRGRHPRCRAHSTTCSSGGPPPTKGAKSTVDALGPLPSSSARLNNRKSQQHRQSNPDKSDQVSIGSVHSDKSHNSASKTNFAQNGAGCAMSHIVKRNSAGPGNNGGHPPTNDRRSLDGAKHNFNNNGSIKYYSMPQRDIAVTTSSTPLVKSASSASQYASTRYGVGSTTGAPNYIYQVPISKQRSLEGENFRVLQSPYGQPNQDGSLSRSISFMVRNDHNGRNGDQDSMHEKYLSVLNSDTGRRSIESTPQSGRRYPLQSPEYGDPSVRGQRNHQHHSRTSSISSMSGHGAVDGFPTPMINRRTAPGTQLEPIPRHQTSESEDSSQSPAKERRAINTGRPKTLSTDLVDSGLSTLTDPEVQSRSNHSLNHRDLNCHIKKPTYEMKERSLTSLSLQVKKPKSRSNRQKIKESEGIHNTNANSVDRSPSLHKISPLQHYILEQAKLSGYRFGDKIPSEKRDSFIDSENESHRTGDDSDAFADDEAPSSDGMEERDDVSLVSTVSSVGEDDNYLSEPTYNNLDPVWAQRHGFGPENSLDIDAFSEEFDLRMRFGRGPSSTCSTIPRPTFAGPPQPPPPRPGSAAPIQIIHSHRDYVDGPHRHNDPMSQSQISDNTGSTLSVSASIHSTLSAGTLTDFENFAASNLNIQKKGIFRKKMSLKDVLSWQAESISKPLTFVNEKNLKKEALAVFKMVQIYMSDRKAKVGMTINSVAQDIVESGFGNANLRDEIYIQLCKQISDNPRRESLRRGWELLAICLAFFPPSETFFPYLLGFIQKHRDPNMDFPDVGRWPIHVQISHYAGICNKRLERIGVGGRLSPKKPTLEDIDQSRLQIFRPSMFGGTLLETLAIQKDKFPSRRLPWILTTLTEQILALNGLGTEGIFRIPADFDEVMSVKCRFDQWEMGVCSDAHVPAALLKQWLRELYIPLIPDDNFYNDAIRVGDDPNLAVSLVQRLPELHRFVLTYLIRFLQLFARSDIVTVTKMDASNLSMVFAPNFLRCPSPDPIVIMENTRKEMAFVKTLIHSLETSSAEGVL
eukprot:TRINITY_DN12798_c0_g1_i1.p1 TRINITY_DN12798_c0_g1~~TRINITY_DN12798_c0_g1_i1.p1  ORF type:complete len:1185 (-),score=141.46 TRINITY_DN12798_c0_g1_i1:1321-4875(-)